MSLVETIAAMLAAAARNLLTKPDVDVALRPMVRLASTHLNMQASGWSGIAAPWEDTPRGVARQTATYWNSDYTLNEVEVK